MPTTINYAVKYAPQVDLRFTQGALSTPFVNQNFDWIGVQTVKVFSRNLATLNNYTASGSNRYGTPDELGNAVQEMTLTQDKSFTYTIDKKTEQDTMGTMEAAATLAENIDNVMIPHLDAYRFGVIAANAPTSGSISGVSHIVTSVATKSNAYEIFLSLQEKLDNDNVPVGGRVAAVSPAYHNLLKLDENFIKRGDLSQEMLLNGQVGEVDGVPIIKVPASRMPTGVDLIITNPIATPAPIKLDEFKIHTDAPGISGSLVEARFRFDTFVLNKKKDAIAIHKTLYSVTVSNDGHGTATASPASGGAGTEVTLTATPASGYIFDKWVVVSGGVTVANNKFTIGASDVTVQATFKTE